MTVVIPLHSLYWSIHTKDESKTRNCICFHLWCELTLALWCHSIVWSLYYEIECNGMTSFMGFMMIYFALLFFTNFSYITVSLMDLYQFRIYIWKVLDFRKAFEDP